MTWGPHLTVTQSEMGMTVRVHSLQTFILTRYGVSKVPVTCSNDRTAVRSTTAPWVSASRLFLALMLLLVAVHPAAAQGVGKIVSIVGKVEIVRAGQGRPAQVGQDLLPGDVVETGPGSRAAILLADESQIKVNANSTVELKQAAPPPGIPAPVAVSLLQTILDLLNGEIWVRTRGESFEIRAPGATATIRGTELNLSIGPADESRLAVLEGVVEFRNPQGSVLVQAGEQAIAKVGEAPRKTVLISPLDAVQWSLYYPGIVSFRDYPLTDIDPALLPERLGEAELKVTAAPNDLDSRIEMGEVLFDLGRSTDARKEFEKALAIDPQAPRAHAGLGWVNLGEGRIEDALGEFRQVRPPTSPALVGTANALYRLDRFDEARQVIAEARRRFPSSPQPPTQAALMYLLEGRVPDALAELDQALKLDPKYALAHGLRSNIHLVQNKKELARQAAEKAVEANPFSPSAHLDLSLVKQAEFQLEAALEAARKAVELDPGNAQALTQVSRLLFGLGQIGEALKVAEEARRRAPQDSLVNSTRGFLLLAQVKIQEASEAFDQAIRADSTRGEPHLGLGLALFRQNKTVEALEEFWIAVLLEPQVSLFHSYLGKALYEVKRDRRAAEQFAIAKALDPRDPTPWFYDAIRKQSVNRPVEALHDLQRSIERNDNQAVYRGRHLLDEDRAARAATLGRIYNELGFQQLALVEGWRSVNVDPTNYSAHRFLADVYSVLPRHEIARVSELLQSQLLQPISITPVQPQLAESELLILDGAGPAEASLNEFNPLFVRDRVTLQASGVLGENETLGDEVVVSGVSSTVSYSLGQFHHETDGFRKNHDLEQDIYNVFVQVSPAYHTSVQTEFRFADTEKGDRDLRFFPNDFLPDQRQDRETQSARLGIHHAFSPSSNIIASVIYRDVKDELRDMVPLGAVNFDTDEDGFLVESQHLFRWGALHIVSGVGHLSTDGSEVRTVPLPFPPFSSTEMDDIDIRHTNLYVYSLINYLENVTVTLGASGDFFDGAFVDRNQGNPKVGVTWNPWPGTTVRAAAFRVLKRSLIADQTIEPTQVAGFNQFFDDNEGTKSWRYGVAIDQTFSAEVYAGAELSKRDLDVPFLDTVTNEVREVDWKEYLARAYLYWTPHPWVAASVEYQFERFDRDREFGAGIEEVDTHRVPLGINVFHPSGLSARLNATYVNQDGTFRPQGGTFESGSDEFWVVDAGLRYRLPNRRGFITVEIKNLFDEEFKFQDTDPANPVIQPDRLIIAGITLSF